MRTKSEHRIAFRNFLQHRKWHYVEDPRDFLRELKQELISFYQRGMFGYARRDMYSLDSYLARVIRNSVQEFEKRTGYGDARLMQTAWKELTKEGITGIGPEPEFLGDVHEIVRDRARKIHHDRLSTIIEGFTSYLDTQYNWSIPSKERDKIMKAAFKKMKVFTDYIDALWV